MVVRGSEVCLLLVCLVISWRCNVHHVNELESSPLLLCVPYSEVYFDANKAVLHYVC